MKAFETLTTTNNRLKLILCICLMAVVLSCLYIFQQKQKQSVNFMSTSIQVWHIKEQRIQRPTYINEDHGFCGPCPKDKQISDAWRLNDLVRNVPLNTPFVLNIGAGSAGGGKYDPTYALLSETNSSFAALLIDPNTNSKLFDTYPNRSNIQIIHDYIWSETIIEDILKKYRVPQNLAVLKVDIDSYECSLLETILHANYRPQFIHTEFNPIFRPPVIFMPIYNSTTKHDWNPSLWMNPGPFYGCSLSALSKILLSYDYLLVEVDFWDVIYIQRQLVEFYHIQIPANDKVAYENGFLGHSCFSYCQRNPKLYNKEITDVIETTLNESNFEERMRRVIDRYAPMSRKTNMKHPYIIKT